MKAQSKFPVVIIAFGIIFLLIFTSCKSIYCNTYSGVPKQIISVDQAVEMKNHYKSKIIPLIEAGSEKEYQATEFAWIDLDSLKKYIAYLDKIQEVNKKNISGIRIYFAAYPEQNTFTSTAQKVLHPGRETVFLAPTIKVPESNLSIQYRNLENLPFYIQPDGKNALIGEFVIIEALRYQSDNKMPIESNAGKSAEGSSDETITNSTSVILDNLGLVPPPKTTR